MKITHFQILNFRSIKDSGRIPFSADGITALVGQNESGKSAVLDALILTFSSAHPVEDDLRHGEKLPTILLETQSDPADFDQFLPLITEEILCNSIAADLKNIDGKLIWKFFSFRGSDGELRITFNFDNLTLYDRKVDRSKLSVEQAALQAATQKKDVSNFRDALYKLAPEFVLFEESSGLLPNKIDVSPEGELEGEGSTAASNFLKIADIDLKYLRAAETKAQAAVLKKANRAITEEFRSFWRQNIGEKSGIELDCAIHQYPLGHPKAAQSYIEFLISDGDNMLHPKQRSKGTIWFISFFLQLRASEISEENHFYLLDEPGANLHERAQDDVMRLIEKISGNIPVLYATHSPYLIRHEKINRIVAVERDTRIPGHPTRLINSHDLGAARTDTLSPIYSAMGVSLARQTAIKEKNNVILEELSAQYYLRAFMELTGCNTEINFISATGVDNVPMLANLFLGWGLQFVVVVDDESSGRRVIGRLKRDLFLDEDDWAKRRLYKIPGCDGIEDIFDPIDYQNILGPKVQLKDGQKNSQWAKSNGAIKAVHALKFWHRVENGEITPEFLTEKSMQRISSLINEIVDRVNNYAAHPKE